MNLNARAAAVTMLSDAGMREQHAVTFHFLLAFALGALLMLLYVL